MSLADLKAETPWSGRDTLIKRCRQNLGFWSQCHLLIKRQRHPNQKANLPWSQVSFADQKVRQPLKVGTRFLVSVTCWSKGRDILIKRHPDQKAETPKLRFLKSVSLADLKVETPWSKGRDTLIKRCRHPNLGFWSQYHLLIKRQRQPPLEVKCHLLIKRWRQPLKSWKLGFWS